jgi:hypothetical protein
VPERTRGASAPSLVRPGERGEEFLLRPRGGMERCSRRLLVALLCSCGHPTQGQGHDGSVKCTDKGLPPNTKPCTGHMAEPPNPLPPDYQ